ncbi:ca2+-binding protein, partial [Vibrio cholerae HC-78A1]
EWRGGDAVSACR